MQFASAKNQNGYLSPSQYMLSINTGQKMYLDFLKGEYEKYQAGRSIPVVAFGQNEMIRTSLKPLIYGTILHPFSYGISPVPDDFEFVDAMWTQYGFNRIKFVEQDTLDSHYNSVIDPVASNPIYLIQHEGFHFFPETIGTARLSYVRKPPSIVWAYNLDSKGRPVYDPFNSQHPIWGDTDMMQIIVRALQLVGINLQLGVVIQYANQIKKDGQ